MPTAPAAILGKILGTKKGDIFCILSSAWKKAQHDMLYTLNSIIIKNKRGWRTSSSSRSRHNDASMSMVG